MRASRKKCYIAMTCFGVFAFQMSGLVLGRNAVTDRANELIRKIMDSEKGIHDVELHYDYIIQAKDDPRKTHVYTSFEWGYEGGKEYFSGKKFSPALVDQGIAAHTDFMNVTFDGEKLRRYREDEVRPGKSRGRICPFEKGHFIFMPPTYLLGYSVTQGRRTFGEILRDTSQVSARTRPDMVDGHRCTVVEAMGIPNSDATSKYDVRAWIDTERDFRPLKIEVYRSISGRNRWKMLTTKYEKIKLKEVDGIWFPVEGMCTGYYPKSMGPPRGMTAIEFARLPRERQREIATFTMAPLPDGPRRMKVTEGSIRINKGIDPKKFTIEFPQGCEIYDDYLGMGYTVGSPEKAADRKIMEELGQPGVEKDADPPVKVVVEPSTSIEPNNIVRIEAAPVEPNEDSGLRPDEDAQDKPEAGPDRSYGEYIMIGVVLAVIGVIWLLLRR